MSESTSNTGQLRQLKMQVQRQLKHHLEQACTYFNKTFIPPNVDYTVRGVKAGVAYLQRNEIRFNPILLAENGLSFIQQVVPHELAHTLVYQQFGRVQPHGKEWKMMMEQVFGVSAEIYHSFDTQNVVGKQFAYQCHCQPHLLSLRRHNAIIRNGRRYLCKQCKQILISKDNLQQALK